MLRLVTRLCQILERPEGDLDPQWAETGALRFLRFGVLNPKTATWTRSGRRPVCLGL